MKIPIPRSLSNAMKIAFETNEMLSFKEARIIRLGMELLGGWIIEPSLGNLHKDIIFKGSLRKRLGIIDLAGF
jgi:hypothetical protein